MGFFLIQLGFLFGVSFESENPLTWRDLFSVFKEAFDADISTFTGMKELREDIKYEFLKPEQIAWLLEVETSTHSTVFGFLEAWRKAGMHDCLVSAAVFERMNNKFPESEAVHIASERASVCMAIGLIPDMKIPVAPISFTSAIKQIAFDKYYINRSRTARYLEPLRRPVVRLSKELQLKRVLKLIQKGRLANVDFILFLRGLFNGAPMYEGKIFAELRALESKLISILELSYIMMIASNTDSISPAAAEFVVDTKNKLIRFLEGPEAKYVLHAEFRTLGMWLLDSRSGLYKEEIERSFLNLLASRPVDFDQTLECFELLDDRKYSGPLADQILKAVFKNIPELESEGRLNEYFARRIESVVSAYAISSLIC